MASSVRDITLHFVRHGETASNADRRFQTPDVPLSDTGRAQAAEIAAKLEASASGAELILASDYARAMETATIIAGHLRLPIVAEPALRERNFGVARGRLYADIGEERLALWRDPHYRIEEGESWADVYDRMTRFLARLREAPPGSNLLLLTHGGAMNVALMCIAAKAIDTFELAPLENCAVRTVTLDGALP